VLAKYDKMVRAIMASLALFRGAKGMINKYAECLVTMLNQADMLGQLESMKRSLFESFNDSEGLKKIG